MTISQRIPQLSIPKIGLKITYEKYHVNLPGANELTTEDSHNGHQKWKITVMNTTTMIHILQNNIAKSVREYYQLHDVPSCSETPGAFPQVLSPGVITGFDLFIPTIPSAKQVRGEMVWEINAEYTGTINWSLHW